MSADIPTATKRLVFGRENGRCALACPRPMVDVHHRRLKGMGGTSALDIHDLSNLIGTCRRHHDLIHAGPARAVLGGWIVPDFDGVTPSMIPAWMVNQNFDRPAWFYLDDSAGIRWASDLNEPLTLLPGMHSLATV